MSAVQRQSRQSALSQMFSLGDRQSQLVQARSNQVVANAVVASVRLSAAQYTAMTAMTHTATLVNHARSLAGSDEYLVIQLCALIEQYVGFAGQQINAFGPCR